MKREDRISEPELLALLERGRTIRPLPDVVRARALARARATVAAADAEALAPAPASRAPASAAPARVGTRRIAIAASVALFVGAGVAVAAFVGRSPDRQEAAPPPSPRAIAPAPISSTPQAPLPSAVIADESTAVAKTRRPARPVTTQESYAAELDLLQRAQVTFAARDFSGALVLVAEHARRFPKGRLAEEREALRVRSLAGSGRADDARHAAAAFANRFPRSVLLPRLREIAGAPEE